jgi:ribonuclease Z
MHGDHFYGLPGLISSMALFGRNEKLTIAGPEPLQGLLENIFQITESRVPFEIEYLVTNPAIPQQILANSKWAIKTVPLQHRIACTGFVIEERGPELRLNVSVCEAMGVPVKQYENIKWGGDWIKDDGSIVSNKVLTLPGNPNRSYAYISDTIYDESLIQHIEGASLLYHEATFMHDLLRRAQETHHSTAKQAGQMATLTKAGKLLIGHFSGRYSHTDDLLQEARESFSEAYVAEEGRTYQL